MYKCPEFTSTLLAQFNIVHDFPLPSNENGVYDEHNVQPEVPLELVPV